MKKKTQKKVDVTEVIVQIQEQLAVLDKKLDAFINKSLTDIAQALATQKAAVAPRPVQPPSAPIRPQVQTHRPKFAVVCFQCGKDCEIPFKPTPGRPVYCPECFTMRKAGHVAPPKGNNEVKPPLEIKTPEQPLLKGKKKAPAPKKTVVKKVVAKKTKKKSSRK